LTNFFSRAQEDTLIYIKSPYRAEYTPHFKLSTFKRGFSNEILKLSLDSLEARPRTSWSRIDSLQFAQISLETGNTALSQYYFDQLKVNYKSEKEYWYDILMIYYIKEDFKGGLKLIHDDSPMIFEFSEIYFFKKIFEANINQQNDEKWFKSNRVFNWDVDSTLNDLDKDKQEFQENVIQPLRNLEFVLKKIISFIHEEDAIIGNSCREMGHIIQGHLSLSQAYIAFSLGRHYNHRDKELLEDLKAVKAKMIQKKYKVPNFRKYFPRIEYWRFDYQMLKEQIMEAKNDTNVYQVPPTMKAKKEPIISFPHELIVIGGIFVFMMLILFILKARTR
jgi:hypothetical protein